MTGLDFHSLRSLLAMCMLSASFGLMAQQSDAAPGPVIEQGYYEDSSAASCTAKKACGVKFTEVKEVALILTNVRCFINFDQPDASTPLVALVSLIVSGNDHDTHLTTFNAPTRRVDETSAGNKRVLQYQIDEQVLKVFSGSQTPVIEATFSKPPCSRCATRVDCNIAGAIK